MFERLSGWHLYRSFIYFFLPAIVLAETENGFLYRWIDNKLHSYLLLQLRTMIERPRVDREDAVL